MLVKKISSLAESKKQDQLKHFSWLFLCSSSIEDALRWCMALIDIEGKAFLIPERNFGEF